MPRTWLQSPGLRYSRLVCGKIKVSIFSQRHECMTQVQHHSDSIKVTRRPNAQEQPRELPKAKGQEGKH